MMGRRGAALGVSILALGGVFACTALVDTSGLAGRAQPVEDAAKAPDAPAPPDAAEASTGEAGACPSSCAAGGRCISSVCVPSVGLLAWWTFDQTGPQILDVSGGGNHGTNQGAKPAPGKSGKGIDLTTNACVLVPESASLRLADATGLTMMAWTKVSGCADPTRDHGMLLNKEDTYELGVECAGSVLTLQEAVTSEPAGWSWHGSAALTPATWQHIAVTWDGTTMRHYVDGAERDSHPQSGTIRAQSSGLGIGCRDVGVDGSAAATREWIAAAVDEVAIYGRALSGAELRAYVEATR